MTKIYHKILIFVLTICILMLQCQGYLEMQLVRIPHHSKSYNYGKVQCLTDLPQKKSDKVSDDDDNNDDDSQQEEEEEQQVSDSDNYQEVCYQKDISYAIELYNDKKQLMLMSLDLTTPISWIKGQRCKIAQTHKSCTRIQINFKEEVASIEKKFKKLLSGQFKHKKSKKSKDDQYALIEGSSEVVKGVLEKSKSLTFDTRDSGHLTRFIDVFLLGLAIIGERDTLKLENTTFINATQLSPNLNFLCDGAISLRFDEKSQSSFIQQMMALAQAKDRYITVYIGQYNQTITFGDLSVKNSAQGLSGIQWINVTQQANGKLAHLRQIALTYEGDEKRKMFGSTLPMVLTLSSSSISIPKKQLEQIIKTFFKKDKCSINPETRYLQCKKLKEKTIKQGEINFASGGIDIMIPLRDLILEQKSHDVTFNIKQALDDRYIILGEPIFRRYFIVLDYLHDRVGFALQRKKFAQKLIDVVILIRFVIWVFLLGCCTIIFSNPIHRCWKIMNKRNVIPRRGGGGVMGILQKRKLKQYKPIADNPYEDVKGKIQDIIDDGNQAEGI